MTGYFCVATESWATEVAALTVAATAETSSGVVATVTAVGVDMLGIPS